MSNRGLCWDYTGNGKISGIFVLYLLLFAPFPLLLLKNLKAFDALWPCILSCPILFFPFPFVPFTVPWSLVTILTLKATLRFNSLCKPIVRAILLRMNWDVCYLASPPKPSAWESVAMIWVQEVLAFNALYHWAVYPVPESKLFLPICCSKDMVSSASASATLTTLVFSCPSLKCGLWIIKYTGLSDAFAVRVRQINSAEDRQLNFTRSQRPAQLVSLLSPSCFAWINGQRLRTRAKNVVTTSLQSREVGWGKGALRNIQALN